MSIEIEYFEIFPWNSNFETGILEIDVQHKKLVDILNHLAAHLANLSEEIVLNDIFDELAEYANFHFTSEENIWHTSFSDDDEWLLEHEQTHGSFINDVLKLKNSNKSLDEVITEIVSYLSQWLAYHILDTDKRMSIVVNTMKAGKTITQAKVIANEQMQGSAKLLVNTVLTMYDSLSTRTLALMKEKSLRKKVEQELKLSEEQWQFILEGAGDNVWDWDLKNDDFYSVEDLPVVELLGKNADKKARIHKDDIERAKKDFKDHLEGKTDYYINKHRVLKENGSWSWVLSRGKVVKRETNGVPTRMVGTHSDITERELASLIYKHSSQAMCISDSKNNMISINPAFTEITGYTVEDCIGKNPKILSSGKQDKEFYKQMWEEIYETGSWNGEIWNRRKTGELYPEILNVNVVYDKYGKIDHFVGLFSDITEKKKAEDLIWKQANFDSLTMLQNRVMFQQQLEREVERSNRSKIPFVLMFVDLDNFKEVNDTLGHDIGDVLLVEVANRIKHNVRHMDTVSRLGGDEFTIICPELDQHNSIDRIASSLVNELAQPYNLKGNIVYLSASIGITLYPYDASNAGELLKNSDQAMYLAKSSGRGTFSYFMESMQKEAKKRQSIIKDLRIAINKHEFELYYQPIFNLKTKKLSKAEALIRWNHPERGMIYPDEFIYLAEESGLIVDIGDWVFKEAMNHVKKWKDKLNIELQISINKSPVQFHSEHTIDEWIKYLDLLGLDGKHCVIEITEGLLMEDKGRTIEKLMRLKEKGVQLSLDDFGTGYSSLSYLKKFDVSYIKIDRSFVMHLSQTSSDKALCEAMVVMANKLGIQVIAEGIETQEQFDILSEMECDYGQGFLFSKGVPASEFEKIIKEMATTI